jgi:predicted cobalt transporter CbtA
MMRTLLVRGMLAGLLAGVLATLFAYFLGEPSVNLAIGFEESTTAHHGSPATTGPGHAHSVTADESDEELVGRGTQSTLGLFTAVALYGVAVGGLFALGFAFVYGRAGTLRPRLTAVALGVSAFVVVFLVPFLKYPANPPAVGQSATIGARTVLYFVFVALSVVFGMLAAVGGAKLTRRFGSWAGGLTAIGSYVLTMAVCAWLLPSVDEVPQGFPGSTLWSFRASSIGTQFVLWTSIALFFGAFAEKSLTSRLRAKLAVQASSL